MYRRGIRSFVRREGRITAAQRTALRELMQIYGLADHDRQWDLDSLFGRYAPRVLEIGCGVGEAVIALAASHPENDYLAVEVHRPCVGHLLQRAHAAALRNLRVICQDATRVLGGLIPDTSLECVYLFFPDPWPKRRHRKRRLIQADFVSLIARKLKPHGRLFFATDWDDYAQHISKTMAQQGQFVNLAGAAVTAPPPHWRPLTRYERRGLQLGHQIHDFVFALR